MINVNEYYKSESDYLKASDLMAGKKFSLTIGEISVTEFEENGSKKQKLTLSFSNAEKKLVLNKTNALAIAYVLGDDAELWKGKSIFVYSTKVDFGGQMVDAIRVDMPLEEAIMAAGPDTAQLTTQLYANKQAAPAQQLPPPLDSPADDIPW